MVDCTALEMRRTGNRTVGSNPTLSAIAKSLMLLRFVGEATPRRKCAILTAMGHCGGRIKLDQNRESAHISLAPIPTVRFEELDAFKAGPVDLLDCPAEQKLLLLHFPIKHDRVGSRKGRAIHPHRLSAADDRLENAW